VAPCSAPPGLAAARLRGPGQALLNYAQTYLLSATGERAVAGLRNELFSRLLDMPPGYFAERKTGELVSRLSTDIGMLQGVLSHQIAEFSRQILSLLGGVAILIFLQPRLTLTTLAVVPVVVGTAMLFGRRLRRVSTGVQDRIAAASGQAEEAFSQIRTVQSFVQEPFERARYGDRIAEVVRTALRRARLRGAFFGIVTFASFGGIVIVLWQGGIMVLQDQLTAGQLVSFLLYTIFIAASVGGLASFFSSYQESSGAAERVFEILEAPASIADPSNPKQLRSPVRAEVTYDRVSFWYQEDVRDPWALQDISLTIHPGETVALVGPSGSGKTTLANLLPRFWDPKRGRVLLDGVDIRHLRLADLRSTIGLVPQEPALFSGTVKQNISYARPDATIEEVENAAKAAHAHEFISQLPKRYATVVGERGVKLSGGQRQRIAIARAILKDPAILVLDEATSSLDTESERLIEDALERLLVGRTTLIIAHRLSTVLRANRLLVLDHGRIVEQGTHQELLKAGGLYARLYQHQFREHAPNNITSAAIAQPSGA
jgi:subfamily B ATP-binding cassette protein MsbA